MSRKAQMSWLLLLLFGVVALSGSTLPGPEQSWSLIGTWVNPKYEQTSGYSAKAGLQRGRNMGSVQEDQ